MISDQALVDGSASSDEDEEEESNLDSLIDDSSVPSGGGHRALLAAQQLDSNRRKNKRIRRGGVLRAAMNHTGTADDFEAAYLRGDLASATPSSVYDSSRYTEESPASPYEDIHSTPGLRRTSPYFHDDIVSPPKDNSPIDVRSPPLFRQPLSVNNQLPSPFLSGQPQGAIVNTKPSTLTAEQRQRIEQNRQAALRRRLR